MFNYNTVFYQTNTHLIHIWKCRLKAWEDDEVLIFNFHLPTPEIITAEEGRGMVRTRHLVQIKSFLSVAHWLIWLEIKGLIFCRNHVVDSLIRVFNIYPSRVELWKIRYLFYYLKFWLCFWHVKYYSAEIEAVVWWQLWL